jgi:hypothetical protein
MQFDYIDAVDDTAPDAGCELASKSSVTDPVGSTYNRHFMSPGNHAPREFIGACSGRTLSRGEMLVKV